MDQSAAGPGGTPVPLDGTTVPVFDEDPEEAFTGPEYLDRFFAEESDTAELFIAGAEEDEYYEGDGSYQPDPLVRSAAQRSITDDGLHAETGSGHTQEGRGCGGAGSKSYGYG